MFIIFKKYKSFVFNDVMLITILNVFLKKMLIHTKTVIFNTFDKCDAAILIAFL